MKSKLLFDDRIKIFEDGTVHRKKDGKWVEVKLDRSSDGGRYKVISLRTDGKQKNYYVHRLVAEAFIDKPEGKTQVNHKDGDKQNNAAYNLEWVTPRENVLHAYRIGLINKLYGMEPCQCCGQPTAAKDLICTKCKEEEKKDVKKEVRCLKINQELSAINMEALTDNEKKTVSLRLQMLSYEEIGSIMGCSKQCIEQRIHAAMKKSGETTQKKSEKKNAIRLKNRIERKKLKLKQLNEEANEIFEEIDILENQLFHLSHREA